MKKTKWLSLFIASVLLVGLFAGCGGGSDKQAGDDKGNTAEEKWTGTITVWDGPRWADKNDNKYFWLEAKKAEFEKLYPGVKIEIVQTPWAEMADKLNVAIAGKKWPDVAPVDIGGGAVSVKQVEQGLIESFDDFLTEDEKSDFYPNALDAYTLDGKLYGIPNSITVNAMLLNLDIFKERNVEPPVNGKWTYDEFVQKMQQLTYDKDGDGKNDVFGFSTYVLPGYYEAWPFLFMDGGFPLSADLKNYTFDSPEAISGLQKLVDLKFKYGVSPTEMGGADVGGTWKAWAAADQRTVAVEPWATWAIAAAKGEKYKTNFMVAEYPVGDSGKSVTIGGIGGWIMFKQESDAKKKVVAEFVKYISSTEEQFTMAQNYGTFPARISTAEKKPFANNPEMERAQQLSEYAVMLPRHPDWKKIDEAIQTQLQLALNGEKTPEQALKDARPAVENILK